MYNYYPDIKTRHRHPKLIPLLYSSALPLLCLTPHREEDGVDVSFSAALMPFAFPALDYGD